MTNTQVNIDKEALINSLKEFSKDLGDRIILKVINLEKNKELLETVPYYAYLDLAVIFYYMIPSEDTEEFHCVLIDNNLYNNWNISIEDMLDLAQENTPKLLGLKVQGLLTTIAEYMDEDSLKEIAETEDRNMPLYVATNKNCCNGAGVMLYKDLFKALASKFKSDLFVIPSSIHEIIVVKAVKGCQVDTDSLKDMIHYVNRNEVPEGDVLSDSLYFYSMDEESLMIA
ncbi:MAG: DUF5688 family protein [Pseudobutyrivibrio sp.]|nr:DUF5688 family protein [Pseudobutyrivibrio sp.]